MTVQLEVIPPSVTYQLDAERHLLGSVLRSHSSMDALVDRLVPADFYAGAHQRLFAAYLTLWGRNEAIDVISLHNLLGQDELERIGGVSFITSLFEGVPVANDLDYYVELVKDKARRRRLLVTIDDLRQAALQPDVNTSELLAHAERDILAIGAGDLRQSSTSINAALPDMVRRFNRWRMAPGQLTGVRTGLKEYDRLTGGLNATRFNVIAGRPGMGKTSLALNFALHAALIERQGVAFFSLEMNSEELMGKIIAGMSGVSEFKMRRGAATQREWDALLRAVNDLRDAPLYIDDDSSITVDGIMAKARRLRQDLAKLPSPIELKLIVVDYIQLMTGKTRENRQAEVAAISRGLKILAKEMNVCLIGLSQLNRGVESRAKTSVEKKPQLSDLRESGAIEQDADEVLFVFRQELYEPDNVDTVGKAELLIRKNRHGPTAELLVGFDKERTRFADMEPVHTEKMEL